MWFDGVHLPAINNSAGWTTENPRSLYGDTGTVSFLALVQVLIQTVSSQPDLGVSSQEPLLPVSCFCRGVLYLRYTP